MDESISILDLDVDLRLNKKSEIFNIKLLNHSVETSNKFVELEKKLSASSKRFEEAEVLRKQEFLNQKIYIQNLASSTAICCFTGLSLLYLYKYGIPFLNTHTVTNTVLHSSTLPPVPEIVEVTTNYKFFNFLVKSTTIITKKTLHYDED